MAARALIAVTDFGVEEAELVEPLNALKKAGIEVTVASNSGESIQTVTGDKDWASKVNADSRLADAKLPITTCSSSPVAPSMRIPCVLTRTDAAWSRSSQLLASQSGLSVTDRGY
ncbi:ThiJ/PfpI family protein [Cutibacterium acnes JCM 18916]|nr:ThiJ/PfpI family protein [Cutibacterium acnes JCM 18916]GAE76948.1 ThiJ/PfpI family protein [Cutibacterium acnes JCM 18918]